MKPFLIIQERGVCPYSALGLSVIPSIILLCDLLNPMSGCQLHQCTNAFSVARLRRHAMFLSLALYLEVDGYSKIFPE